MWGDRGHRRNLISLDPPERDRPRGAQPASHRKYARIDEEEQRADLYRCEDAEVLLVACNTPARMAKGAVEALRSKGVRAGLFRPLTLWPFPIRLLRPLLSGGRRLVVVEASAASSRTSCGWP